MILACLALSVFESGWKFAEGIPGADALRYLTAGGYALAILVVVIQFNLFFLEKLNIQIRSKKLKFILYRLPLLIFLLPALTTPWRLCAS